MDKGLNPLNLCTSPISWVWKIKSNQRIIFFFWLFSHNTIPTCKVLGSRGSLLTLFARYVWIVLSLLFTCSVIVNMPIYFGKSLVFLIRSYSLSLPLLDWLKVNTFNSFTSKHLGISWEVLFTIGIWHLWL